MPALVGVNPLFTHHMADIRPDPDAFDPLRFTDEAQPNRHRFAFVPFGGGAHMCLGLHFADMQAKCFARHFLQNLSASLPKDSKPGWQMWPIPKPREGLRVALEALSRRSPREPCAAPHSPAAAGSSCGRR